MLPKLANDFIVRGSTVKVTRKNGSVTFGVVESIRHSADGQKIVELKGRNEMFNVGVDKVEAIDD